MDDLKFTFDDVLIKPKFSMVRSRKDVDLSLNFLNIPLSLPIINANMDTVASVDLCKTINNYGALGSLHRFCNIEKNVQIFKDIMQYSIKKPIVSVGIGDFELERARALVKEGAEVLLLDVAHAACTIALEMFTTLKTEFPNVKIIVGNFGTAEELQEFLTRQPFSPDAVKVGIGGGSLCTTRLVTGVGVPTLSSVLECVAITKPRGIQLIADGGMRHVGDIVKALSAGADVVMLGSMFAGTDESSGTLISNASGSFKEYRGSASHASYEVQGKVAAWRAPEGEATLVPYKGSVLNVLNNINGGLRSACSYVGAFNLKELREKTSFIFISGSSIVENRAHGK